jgi:hypothetical protein
MANTLFNQKTTSIKVNVGASGGIVGSPMSANTITLTNSALGKRKLSELEDVDDTVEVDGGTLVYDAASDEYVLQALNLDGGSF